MADAVNFPGSNFTFKAPPDCDDVRDLHTFRQHDGPCNVSCWELRPDELDEVNRTGMVHRLGVAQTYGGLADLAKKVRPLADSIDTFMAAISDNEEAA